MKSLADGLPPEIAQQIHPEWRRNEREYWAARDQLLEKFRDQWIGFADGAVIASGASAVDVFHRAQASGLHPYITCVGREDEPCRMRRSTYSYDTTYPGAALPVITVVFRTTSGSPGTVLDQVVVDTGADASAVPWSDCQQMQLAPIQGVPGIIGGVGGSRAATVVFQVWAWLDGTEYPCRLQADFLGSERILGRDVLNQLEVLFRGPAGEVVINP
jgi:predicted aspartyl protease